MWIFNGFPECLNSIVAAAPRLFCYFLFLLRELNGREGDRTPDLLAASEALSQAELHAHNQV